MSTTDYKDMDANDNRKFVGRHRNEDNQNNNITIKTWKCAKCDHVNS